MLTVKSSCPLVSDGIVAAAASPNYLALKKTKRLRPMWKADLPRREMSRVTSLLCTTTMTSWMIAWMLWLFKLRDDEWLWQR